MQKANTYQNFQTIIGLSIDNASSSFCLSCEVPPAPTVIIFRSLDFTATTILLLTNISKNLIANIQILFQTTKWQFISSPKGRGVFLPKTI